MLVSSIATIKGTCFYCYSSFLGGEIVAVEFVMKVLVGEGGEGGGEGILSPDLLMDRLKPLFGLSKS